MYSSFISLNLLKNPSGQNIFTHKHFEMERQNFHLQYVWLGVFISVDFGWLVSCGFVVGGHFFFVVWFICLFDCLVGCFWLCFLTLFVSTNP